MKRTHKVVKTMMALAVIGGLALSGSAQQLTMQVDAGKTGPQISPYMYGFFTELLSNMYTGGLRAEMLGDRKFFYPVNSSPLLTPQNTRRFVGRWRPVGPDDAVVMDKTRVWVGEHSPRVTVDATSPRGIRQAGLGIRAGRKYTGGVILMADPGADISVSLIWGSKATDRQTIRIRIVGSDYAKYPLSFTAGGDTDDAALEIVGTGTGTFHIGAASMMPADNIDGYRADMINLYKEIGPTLARWPGGNFTSGYDWRDGIGDPDKRPPRYDYAWNALESNDMGIDEFMQLTDILGLEPYICVNDGFGDAFSAAQEVEYFNGPATSPMGKLRAANGHPEPYKVKYWNIGNEMYGSWQLGHMSLYHYTIKHNMFAEAMRAVDPGIYIIASGATPAEMSTTGAGFSITGKKVTKFGDPIADWDAGLLTHSAPYFDSLAEHLYPRAEQAFDNDKQEWVKTDDSITDKSRRLPNRVKCAADAWDEYQKMFPQLDMKNIKISLDEWVAGRVTGASDMYRSLSAAEGLQEMFRRSDVYGFSAYTALSSLLTWNKTDATPSSLGLMFELYRRHYGTIPVEVTGNSPQHDIAGTVMVDKPKVPSGSPTYPLDVTAALTADRKTLTVSIVNPSGEPQQIDASFAGVKLQGSGKLYRLAPSGADVRNEPGKPRVLDIVESSLNNMPAKLTIPESSVSIYELPIQ